MIKVNVKVDIDRAIRKLDATAKAVRRALPRALNKTATTARAESAREIKVAGYGLKVTVIRKAISINRATVARPVAVLVARGAPIPLIQYQARQTRSGVTVSVLKGRKLVKGSFIATMPSGHKGVFRRVGRTHKRVRRGDKVVRHGLPIKEIYGPAVPDAFINEKVQAAVQAAIRNRFPVVFRQELRFEGLRGQRG